MVHGGIVTTLLDEAMAWAISTRGIWAVTAKIEVRFPAPGRHRVAAASAGPAGG
jgi:acyl-coenzyme A thioesterase PaaI-like protein